MINIILYLLLSNISIILYFYFYNKNSKHYIKKILNFKTFIYPMAWEDYKIDCKYLNINNNDNILMITTGGCNVLNNLILNPNQIVSCDLSPSQNALLDLKISAIKNLDFNDFWKLFGVGKHKNFEELYNTKLKKDLKLHSSIEFWNNNLNILSYNGLYKSGKCCEIINFLNILFKDKFAKFCNFTNVNEQYDYYLKNIEPILFNKNIKHLLKIFIFEFAGVPNSQIKIICDGEYNKDKLYTFIKKSYTMVAKNWSIKNENHFFHVLLMGYYTKNNCPEYLREENFEYLKKNIKKIKLFNGTLNDYMNNKNNKFDKFILLDHMDWYDDENQIDNIFNLMYNNSNKNAFGLFRSGNSKSWITEYIKKIKNYNLIELCHECENDRLGTYPGFFKFKILN